MVRSITSTVLLKRGLAELRVITDRLTDLRRRQIASERSQPSPIIAESLGPRPKDPLKAALWNEVGVDISTGPTVDA